MILTVKLFWNININISIIFFTVYILYFIAVYYGLYLPEILIDEFGILFFLSPFLEFFQIPICLVVTLFTLNKQKKIVWLYFIMMAAFFILKFSIYIFILGSIIPVNTP